MLFNPTYGWYGVMILTSHKLFQLLTPFAFLGIFLSSLILGFIEVPGLIHTMLFFKLLTVLLVVGSAYFASTKLLKNFKPIIFLNYFIATNYIIVLGWIDFIKGKKIVTWKKIESSREF